MALWRCLTLIDYKGSLDHYFKWTFQWHAVMAEINMTNRELDDCGIGITDLEFSKLLNVWMTFQKLTTNVCMCFHSWEKYWIAFFLENYTVFNNELGGRREKKKKDMPFFTPIYVAKANVVTSPFINSEVSLMEPSKQLTNIHFFMMIIF